jgi:hypothetical protein
VTARHGRRGALSVANVVSTSAPNVQKASVSDYVDSRLAPHLLHPFSSCISNMISSHLSNVQVGRQCSCVTCQVSWIPQSPSMSIISFLLPYLFAGASVSEGTVLVSTPPFIIFALFFGLRVRRVRSDFLIRKSLPFLALDPFWTCFDLPLSTCRRS